MQAVLQSTTYPFGRENESDGDREAVRNGARREVARVGNFTIVENPEAEVDAGSPQEVTVEGVIKNERVLTPEQAGRVLGAIQSRFNANLHKGISWEDVAGSLEASPEALWSLAQMESAGHAPDVYHDDKSDYYFGTCSLETPESARNCVYNKEAADWLRTNAPQVVFNGSAVEMADAMGIALMLPEHYRDILQKKGKFDKETWSWLLTQSDVRSAGDAFVGIRGGDNVSVNQNNANNHNDNRAWRGSLKAYWLYVDLSHPPVILPISSSFARSWKILVSLTNLNSKRSLAFIMATSIAALALMR